MSENDLLVIICPPLSDFPEAPKEHSHCELFDCPKCKEKMWLSEKKKKVLLIASLMDKQIILACYHCIKKMSKQNPSLFKESEMVNL